MFDYRPQIVITEPSAKHPFSRSNHKKQRMLIRERCLCVVVLAPRLLWEDPSSHRFLVRKCCWHLVRSGFMRLKLANGVTMYITCLCKNCDSSFSAAASNLGTEVICGSCQKVTVAEASEELEQPLVDFLQDNGAADILLTTGADIPNRTVDSLLDIVEGSAVMSKHAGRDLAAGLKSIVGGEIRGYTELLQDARRQARMRMVAMAKSLKADAVLNVRYATSAVSPGMSELLAYGTAVTLVDDRPGG